MLEKGVIPIPPARKTAGLDELLCSVNEPIGPSILTSVSAAAVRRKRLKAVSLIRVANRRYSSSGALAIENDLMLPSASVSGGSISVRSIYWPGLNWKPAGLAK